MILKKKSRSIPKGFRINFLIFYEFKLIMLSFNNNYYLSSKATALIGEPLPSLILNGNPI